MIDFVEEEKGLFTFYREQLELQQSIKEQKLKKDRKKSQLQPKIHKQKPNKQIRNSLKEQPLRRNDKQINMQNQKLYVRNSSDFQLRNRKIYLDKEEQIADGEREKNYHSIDFKKVQQDKANHLSISDEIFKSKKDHNTKLFPNDKHLLKIKEMSSNVFDQLQVNTDEVFNNEKMLKRNFRKIHKSKEKITPEEGKLPKIEKNLNKFSKEDVKKSSNELMSNYKSKDILSNNKKFNLNNPMKVKTNFVLGGQEKKSSEEVIHRKQSFILQLLGKYKLAK